MLGDTVAGFGQILLSEKQLVAVRNTAFLITLLWDRTEKRGEQTPRGWAVGEKEATTLLEKTQTDWVCGPVVISSAELASWGETDRWWCWEVIEWRVKLGGVCWLLEPTIILMFSAAASWSGMSFFFSSQIFPFRVSTVNHLPPSDTIYLHVLIGPSSRPSGISNLSIHLQIHYIHHLSSEHIRTSSIQDIQHGLFLSCPHPWSSPASFLPKTTSTSSAL